MTDRLEREIAFYQGEVLSIAAAMEAFKAQPHPDGCEAHARVLASMSRSLERARAALAALEEELPKAAE